MSEANELLVGKAYRTGRLGRCSLLLALITISPSSSAAGAELQRVTLDAWDDYVRHHEELLRARVNGGKPFLWIDEVSDRAARVRQGAIVVEPAVENGTKVVTDGLIHHWIGSVFIPNATVGNLAAVIRDYGRYPEIYKPAVMEAHVLPSTDGAPNYSMVWQRRVLFVTAAVQLSYRSNDFAVDERRGYTVAGATRIQQIENYRRRGQRLLPPDTGSGYIWRIQSIVRYDERDGGVYLEMEALALTRDIPSSVRWLVNPVIRRLSTESLTATLQQTRKAVQAAPLRQSDLTARDRKRGD
jgi:hypothetical protein